MFTAYAKIDKNTYREVFGLDFEDFKKGQVFRHRPGLTISQQDNTDEALDTINSAQLHYDAHYAEQTEWKHCLGVSTMTLQKVLGSTWKTFARKRRISKFDSIAMTHPVYGGDTLYAESEILEIGDKKNDCGELFVETRGINQKGDIVTKIQYRILIYLKDKHPYYGQNFLDYNLKDEKFSAYKIEEDGGLKEQIGLYFEDLNKGEIYEHSPSKIISHEEALQHALRSLEWNPMYIDKGYYKKHFNNDQCPVTEAYLIGAVTACTTRTFGRVVANLAWKDMKLEREIFPGETIRVKSEIIDKRESHSRPTQGIVHVKGYCHDDKDLEIMTFDRVFLIYKKGLGPYKKAGY